MTPWTLLINTNNVLVVTNSSYGAVGDGVFTNTTAFQNAINAAAGGGVTNGLRGGEVEVPSGIFLCGPLTLKSNVRIQLDSNAVVRLLPYGAWPGAPYTGTVSPLINGSSLTNIAVTGAGMFDGQGSPWWVAYEADNINRPLILSLQPCSEVLFQGFTSSNPPVAHIALKGAGGNINIIGVTLLAPDSSDPVNPSHNTDGVDFAETNALFQDCVISTGDDNIAIGSSGSVSKDILVTNCFFGFGHGLSIGSYTSGGVSNLTVVSCTFSNTGNGIKIKSERNRGGIVQNCNYSNLTMTNVPGPIQIYAYYEYGIGTLTKLTPAFVANTAFTSTNPVPYEPPIYRNITISNVTATASGNGQPPLLLWGLPDYPVSNIVFQAVNINSISNYVSGIFNTTNVQFIDCSFPVPAGVKTFQLWNADLTFTNSFLGTNLLFLDGLTTNGIGSTLDFYNIQATVSNTNAIAGGAITLGGSTLTVSNNLSLIPASFPSPNPLNFVAGTNPTTLAVKGNLAVGGFTMPGGTVNVAAGPGFTNGTYPLIIFTGNFSGLIHGAAPPGYTSFWGGDTAGELDFIVLPPPPGIPAKLTALGSNLLIGLNWSASSNAAGYNLYRSTTNGGSYSIIAGLAGTNFADMAVSPGVTYYYVVTATNFPQESADSIQASAVPLPSLATTNLNFQMNGNQLQLSWPADHLGWRLQIQTNSLADGIGTNWVTVPNSTNIISTNVIMSATNGSVFFRLIYP